MKKSIFILLLFCCVPMAAQGNFEVFFDFNKDVPNTVSMHFFREWAKAHPKAEITMVSGFCDSVDNNTYNLDLAQRRVASVVQLLKESGFSFDADFKTQAIGEDFSQSKIQAENRKASISFREKQEKPKTYADILSEEIKDAKTGDLIRLQNINFYNYSAKILPKSGETLNDLLCVLQDNPKLKIEIQGHICCQTEKDRYDVSEARARAIYLFLLRKGINRKRLSFKGYGNTRPIYPIPEQSEEEKEANRRVEIKILEK